MIYIFNHWKLNYFSGFSLVFCLRTSSKAFAKRWSITTKGTWKVRLPLEGRPQGKSFHVGGQGVLSQDLSWIRAYCRFPPTHSTDLGTRQMIDSDLFGIVPTIALPRIRCFFLFPLVFSIIALDNCHATLLSCTKAN